MQINKNENKYNSDDDIVEIREPDKIFENKLIDSYDSDNDDDEMNLALDVSRNEYLTHNNLYDNTFIDDQIKKAVELSIEEHTNKLEEIAKEESIKLENERLINIEISNRKKSLENFSKRIKSLSLSVNELEIKNFIENILNDYFNLNIDYVIIEKNMYDKIYKIIDSYYFIPIQKNYKKTAISKEEDKIIRSIFRI
jgi:hypothetical protein